MFNKLYTRSMVATTKDREFKLMPISKNNKKNRSHKSWLKKMNNQRHQAKRWLKAQKRKEAEKNG